MKGSAVDVTSLNQSLAARKFRLEAIFVRLFWQMLSNRINFRLTDNIIHTEINTSVHEIIFVTLYVNICVFLAQKKWDLVSELCRNS